MEGIQDVLEVVRDHELVSGHFRGLLHIAIGRKIATADGTVVSAGSTWRELADCLRTLRFEPELAGELGLDPSGLHPRDRLKFWYAVISQAQVESPAAIAEADRLAVALRPHGIFVGPAPVGLPPRVRKAPVPPPAESEPKPTKKPGKKKK